MCVAQSEGYALAGWRNLGTLAPNSGVIAEDINDRAVVVGGPWFGYPRAFRWTPERGMEALESPGNSFSYARAINAAGDIAGTAMNGRAVLWPATGGIVDLGALPGATSSSAVAINGRSEVVGHSDIGSFIWSADRGLRRLSSPGSPLAIDGHGHIVGAAGTSCFFGSEAEGFQDIGTLGGPCVPRAINDLHQIVGFSNGPDGRENAFIWTPGTGIGRIPGTADYPVSSAFDINENGMVVGSLVTNLGQTHGFVWTAARGFQILGDRSLFHVNNFGQVVAKRSPSFAEPMLGQVRFTLGTSDFSGDTSPDLLWRHHDGRLAAWLMAGTRIADGQIFSLTVSEGWVVAGIGDFNSDQSVDIVWQHDDGTLAIWFMQGTNLLDGRLLSPSRVDDREWRVVGVADVDGDARPDLVWQHRQNGRLAAWFMNGPIIREGVLLAPELTDIEWRVATVADLNGDSSPDLVLRNERTAALAVWFLFGPTLGDGTMVSVAADRSWTVRGAADLNGDARADLLWQHDDGTPAVWLMHGTVMVDGFLLPRPAAGWTLAGPR